MSNTVKTIEIKSKGVKETQAQFDALRKSIDNTEKSIVELTKEFGEGSEQVLKAESDLKKLNKAYQDLGKTATDVGGRFEDFYGDLQPLTGRIGELEDRLYELALAGKQNTKEFKDLLAETASMKRVIVETDMVVDGMSQTMAQKLGGALSGLAGALQVGAGAMGTFGVESEAITTMQAIVSEPTYNNAPGLTLNSSSIISTTKKTRVSYTVSITTALNLLNLTGGGQAFLEISANGTSWTTINSAGVSRTLTIGVAVGVGETAYYNIQGEVPKGYYRRIRTTTSGGASVAFVSGQEVQY